LLVIDLFDVQGVISPARRCAVVVFGRSAPTFTNPLRCSRTLMAVRAARRRRRRLPAHRVLERGSSERPSGTVIRLDELQDGFPVVERSPAAPPPPSSRLERIKQVAQAEPLAADGETAARPRRRALPPFARCRDPPAHAPTQAVIRLAFSMCRNSFGPCASTADPARR